jgi:hypothetical protein
MNRGRTLRIILYAVIGLLLGLLILLISCKKIEYVEVEKNPCKWCTTIAKRNPDVVVKTWKVCDENEIYALEHSRVLVTAGSISYYEITTCR